MANSRVRLYEGIDGDSTVIGLSSRATSALGSAMLERFFTEHGYTHRSLNPRVRRASWMYRIKAHRRVPEQSVSLAHIEVRPPLADEHIAAFCEVVTNPDVVDAGHNYAIVIDNREIPPATDIRQPDGKVLKVA